MRVSLSSRIQYQCKLESKLPQRQREHPIGALRCSLIVLLSGIDVLSTYNQSTCCACTRKLPIDTHLQDHLGILICLSQNQLCTAPAHQSGWEHGIDAAPEWLCIVPRAVQIAQTVACRAQPLWLLRTCTGCGSLCIASCTAGYPADDVLA